MLPSFTVVVETTILGNQSGFQQGRSHDNVDERNVRTCPASVRGNFDVCEEDHFCEEITLRGPISRSALLDDVIYDIGGYSVIFELELYQIPITVTSNLSNHAVNRFKS